VLQAANLGKLSGIRHAFFTREGGVSDGPYASLNGGLGSGDATDKVAENRARMAAALGLVPDRLLSVFQIHSPEVVIAEAPWPRDQRPRADAMVTRTPGLALGVSTADCGPLLFADEQARVIGAAHAGWRGALAGVIEATVAAMETLGAERARIAAALGPTIRQPNYEVGADFTARFTEADPDNACFFSAAAKPGHTMFDLPGYIAARIRRAGVGQFEDLKFCNYADPARFFSYRRMTHRGEADYGRHVNAIALAD
jgi:YfiH family protein